jgi:zinc protease
MKRFVRITLLLVLMLSLAPAWAQNFGVKETVLPNGLKVLTKEVHSAPVVSFMVWYKAGSRNERLGKTGISHLLEHMQFKGTKTFGKGEIDRLIRTSGGVGNAATWKDYTFYYETLSSDKLSLAMRIEADRMTGSLLDAEELAREKVVVRSELEGRENNPDSQLYNELYSSAFKAHPYEWPTVGWQPDLMSINRNDILSYYKTFYVPNNATVVIVGDFDTRQALNLVNKYFGRIPKGPAPPAVTAKEPEQMGERRSKLEMSGEAYRVMMGFHVPAVGHPDTYALDVLEIILSGGRSSRLYKSLVDKGITTDSWASNSSGRDPGLFMLGATAQSGTKIEDVEKALLAELEKLKTGPASNDELQKALNQLEAQFIYTNDSVTNQARLLGTYETIGSWRLLESYLPNAQKVTAVDVQRVAQKYLTERNRTVVTFIPGSSNGTTGTPSPSPAGPVHYKPMDNGYAKMSAPGVSAPKTDKLPVRAVLDNGMVLIIQENRSNPTVGVYGSLNAGSMLQPAGKYGLAQVTADMLTRGTGRRTAEEIAAQTEGVGMSISTGAAVEGATFSGYALSRNFNLMLDILSDVLRNPAFPEAEFQKLKAQRLSEIREQLDDPSALAFRAFYGSIYPKGHPFYQPPVDREIEALTNITAQDAESFYKKCYGPAGAILVVVGDVDAKETIAAVKKYFGDWKGGSKVRPAIPNAAPVKGIKKEVIQIPDKSQAEVILGYPGGLKRTDPDLYAANVMNFILGGGGALDSRMGRQIRDRMGLVYSVYSAFDAGLGAGPWFAELGANPENVDKAAAEIVNQMKLMKSKGVTKKEVDDAVAFIAGSFPVRLETNSAVARVLHAAELYGLGMDYLRNYQKIYRAVTVGQVNAAAKKYLHPQDYILVIAGTYKNGQTKP